MGVGRRRFLQIGGAAATSFVGGYFGAGVRSVTDPVSSVKNGPLDVLEPVERNGHVVKENADCYVVQEEWPSFFTPFRFSTQVRIPMRVLEGMPDTQIRNPFAVYDDSVDSDVVRNTVKRMQKSIIRSYRGSNNRFVGDIGSILVPEIARYVQHIKYIDDADIDQTFVDYAQYPMETIYLGVGDCEDFSILFTSLVSNFTQYEIRTGLVVVSNHIVPLLAVPDLKQSEKYEVYTRVDGVPYTAVETAKPNPVYSTPESLDEEHTALYVDNKFESVNYRKAPTTVLDVVRTR